jgi:hypothetical protein
MRIFGFAGHQNYDSPAKAGTPHLLETILLQPTVERTSAQPEGLRRFTRIAIISGQRFLDKECLHFFEAHFLEIARFAAAMRQSQIACADLSILRHKHGAFDDMVQFSNIARKAML